MKKKDEGQTVPSEPKVESDDDDMLNLDNPLYSLTHYVDNEEELVAQMFASIKGPKLDAMMPSFLQEIPLIEVQQLCLHELRGMSRRRILSIVNGQEMSGSSSEDEAEEETKAGSKANEDPNITATKAMLAEAELALENGDEAANLTAMDLLELEMRAKLIKTMLEKQGIKQEPGLADELNGFDPNIKIKQEPVTPERRSRRSRSGSSSSSRSSYSSSYSSSSSSSGSSSRSSSRSSARKSGSKGKSKKLTRKEFENRMKEARRNRKYRGRKQSDEELAEKKHKKLKDRIDQESGDKKEEMDESAAMETEDNKETEAKEIPDELGASENTRAEEGPEEGEEEEGEVLEKEEGELDSNEDFSTDEFGRIKRRYKKKEPESGGAKSDSDSDSDRSRSRRSRKKKKKHRKRRHKSPEKPKIPNWKSGEDSNKLPLNQNSIKDVVTLETEEFPTKDAIEPEDPSTKDIRQSISFAIQKKSAPSKTNPELEDDLMNADEGQIRMERDISKMTLNPVTGQLEMKETEAAPKGAFNDFYKGADELHLSADENESRDSSKFNQNSGFSTEVHNVDIIGTIEPKDTDEIENNADDDVAGCSWSRRWLQSDKVQKVVSNSKMLSKVRKSIQAKGKKAPTEGLKSSSPTTMTPEPVRDAGKTSAVLGSMDDYERMTGIKVKAPTSLPTAKPASKPAPAAASASAIAGLLDSGDEDSEEEAIWSSIMQN